MNRQIRSTMAVLLFPKVIQLLMVPLVCLFFFCACSDDAARHAMHLNEKAYYNYYRSLDSVRIYADSVLRMHSIPDVARAEAMNHLTFYYIGKMQYHEADSLIREVYNTTDNQTELCIAAIQKMRLCQRRSDNKSFYEYRQRTMRHFKRIYEEQGTLHSNENAHKDSHSHRRLIYAETEYRLVSSVYDYYVGQIESAVSMLRELDSIPCLRQDTVQYVAYLYDIGSGGMLTRGSKEDIRHQELEYMMQCFVISSDMGYTYWRANALQSLSEQILNLDDIQQLDMDLARRYLNTDGVPDSLLAGNLAEQALALFNQHGDVYQQAATWRTLCRCYSKLGDYHGAVYSLQQAFSDSAAVSQAPALMASIHEQFSLAYSAMNMKPESDYHRNLYLDLYENTRQDRQTEARIEQLDQRVGRLRILIYGIIILASLLFALLVFLVVKRHRMQRHGKDSARIAQLRERRRSRIDAMTEQYEELEEQCAVKELELSRLQEAYAEQRAKMHLINSLMPLLDRMLHETDSLCRKDEQPDVRQHRRDYINELLSTINQENNFLTEWIQMKRGELSLHIETFPLQPLFDVIANNSATIRRHGVHLDITTTDLSVKADRTLTLFILNTLCDNARKFTPEGGTISIYAKESSDSMVEISVKDTGEGMTEEQVAHLFDVKPIADESLHDGVPQHARSHGFGLLNSKGIIEKYKKTNALFSQCVFDVESTLGSGTRFYFRLPLGVRKTLAVFAFMVLLPCCGASAAGSNAHTVSQLADSVYTCNVEGRYQDAISFASRLLQTLNSQHLSEYESRDSLLLYDSILTVPADIRWLRNSVRANYQILLSVRNEVAVAALALHEWELYKYNNSVYVQLYQEMSVDESLVVYFSRMQAAEQNSNVAVIMLLLLILSLIPIYYFAYYRYVIHDVKSEMQGMRKDIAEHEQQFDELQSRYERLAFEADRLHVTNNIMSNSFSAIKHETMYYPSRLRQLLTDVDADAQELDEVARYYRAVYGMLSAQAQYNCRYQLPVNVLRDMMLRLMGQLSGRRKTDLAAEQQDRYAVYSFALRQPVRNASEQTVKLKVLTLVVRDLGELYDLRRCGVNQSDGSVTVIAPAFE